MIQGVPESTSVVLSIGQHGRDRSGAKAISEQTEVPEKREAVRLSSLSESKSRQNASEVQNLEQTVAKLQDTLNQIDPKIQFSVEEDLNQVVVKVVERDSGELIRQFPPEEVLRVQRFFEEQRGFLLKEEA
ncbi:MAG: flagellar protein FlaG [Nitrospirales bacterium]|nr:flagellar protein FlaG [Nitrospira sp.]MDR4502374.1 flagellar protein FlaG [Nitrospirales bacterium]